MSSIVMTSLLTVCVCMCLCHTVVSTTEQQQQQTLRYEAPDDCKWWIREPSSSSSNAQSSSASSSSSSGGNSVSADEVTLTCKLRTINSEFDTTNFSVIPSEHTTSLRIECNELLLLKSSLDDRSFYHLTRLRELVLDHCKLAKWPAATLVGLRDLRNLTVRTRNIEWSSMNLEISPHSFVHVRQLERLDLSLNNIWSFPEAIFCPLSNLVLLNVSWNRLQDVGEIGFRDKSISVQSQDGVVASPQDGGGAYRQKKTQQDGVAAHQHRNHHNHYPRDDVVTDGFARAKPLATCNLDIQILDAAWNHFVLMPTNGFATLRRLKELYLSDNEISMVADKAFSGLKSLQVLDLSNNKIVALPPELFRDCASVVKEIHLQNNSISVLAPELFSNLSHLLLLDLSRNHLTSAWINSETFSGLIRLVLLNLSHNRITRLDPSFFRDLYTLQILNLEHNLLDNIPANTFSPMNNLHTLVLSYNKIAYLDAYALNELYVLSLLSLDNNILQGIHTDAFRNCSSLQDLNLNGNSLTSVPLALKNMIHLRTVDLGENNIDNLDNPPFIGMTNLYGLRLIGNQLTNLSRNVFQDLPSLQILNLARNRIEHIDPDVFESNSNLQAIRLDANYLVDISRLFVNVHSLLWLNVSDNLIEWFDYAFLPSNLQWLDIHKNHIIDLGNHYNLDRELHIQTLDASFNRLTHITSISIPNSVELLFLNDNLISDVDPHTFVKKINLTRVDLYANQIVRMDLNALRLSTSTIDHDRPLANFYIGGNPFECDCTMEWLQRINDLDHHAHVKDLDIIYCKLLYNRDDLYVPLVHVQSIQFLCTYRTHCFALCHCCEFDACDCEMTCPNNCTCYHDQSWSSNIVECSTIDYTRIPPRIPMDATELYLDGNNIRVLASHAFIGRKNLKILFANHSNIEIIHNNTFSGLKRLSILHLESNRLRELKGFELSTVDNLRELYLHDNRLSHVHNVTFANLHKLEILRIDNNRLISFPVWLLSIKSPYLIEIGLSDNPWSCNCKFLHPFLTWLQGNFAKIVDFHKIRCHFYNSHINITTTNNNQHHHNTIALAQFKNNNDTCAAITGITNKTIVDNQIINDYLPLLLVTLSVFLVCVAFFCAAFYYRTEIRVWMYARCGLRMCYKNTNPNNTNNTNNTTFDDEQDRLFDAYVSYSVKDNDFVGQVLAPGLEQIDPHYRLCLHYRDFSVSAYLADTIVEAVESSRRTVVVLSHNFVHSEWCRFEFKSALHGVLKDRRRRLIIVLLGDVPQRDLDPDLRLYLKTNTCIEWGDRLFWQKLRFAMPDVKKKKQKNRHHACAANATFLENRKKNMAAAAVVQEHHHHKMAAAVQEHHHHKMADVPEQMTTTTTTTLQHKMADVQEQMTTTTTTLQEQHKMASFQEQMNVTSPQHVMTTLQQQQQQLTLVTSSQQQTTTAKVLQPFLNHNNIHNGVPERKSSRRVPQGLWA